MEQEEGAPPSVIGRKDERAEGGRSEEGPMEGSPFEELAASVSRLSMAAETAQAPKAVSFGRRDGGRGLPGAAKAFKNRAQQEAPG